MSAEAEATDILVRMMMEGGEYFLRISGAAAEKVLALLFAGVKTVYELSKGSQKLGGKMNARSFIKSFAASSIFPLSKDDFDKLKPELKRLHIPYMQYKTTKEMNAEGRIEISVRREDAEKFIRLAENLGIATVSPFAANVSEMSAEEYEQALSDGSAKGVDVTVSENGIMINENENPTLAPSDHSHLSELNSDDYNPFETIFNPNLSVEQNLANAKIVAARQNGQLIPISADKGTLLVSTNADNVIVTIPGTSKKERLVIPREDIVSMNAFSNKSIVADLKADKVYDILDNSNNRIRSVTGENIKASGKWNHFYTQKKMGQSPRVPIAKGGTK